MRLRRGVILGLTVFGVLLLTWAVSEDPMAGKMVGAVGCWLLAYVYAQVTEPPEETLRRRALRDLDR